MRGPESVFSDVQKSGSICDTCMMAESKPAAATICRRKVTTSRKDCSKFWFTLQLRPVFLGVTLALLFGSACSLHIMSNDVNSVVDIKKEEPIKLQWGIQDTSASVGKVFNFHIPQDTFQGNVHSYKVFEAGKDVLPQWLTFNPDLNALQGVPSSAEKGKYNLEVVAHNSDYLPEAKDVFLITVNEDTPHVSSSKPLKSMGKTLAKPVNCNAGEPVTMVTVVVDTDLDQLPPLGKFNLAQKLASHLNIAGEMLKMAPVGDRAKFDSSALVAGPGDAKSSKFSGAFVSWLVGCGKVEPDHMPILQQVETSSANGVMSSAIGHGIVGWHVTNSRLKPTVKRVRRQVYATATPGMTLAPPTRVPVSTVTATDQVVPAEPDMTRVVPSMVSPTFTEIEPTPSKPPSVVPTSRQQPPKVSPTPTEIRPTKVVDVEATKVTPKEPTGISPSEAAMTRSQVLEPSMPVTTAEATRKTDMLPSTTEVTKEPTEGTRPTEATRVPPVITTTTEPTRPTPRRTTKPAEIPKPVHPFSCPEDGVDRHPEVREEIQNVQVEVGQLLRFKIPENAFYDCEDGNTRKLVVDVVTSDKGTIEDQIDWLRLDKKKQLLIGLPMAKDGGKVYELLVVVIDSKGAAARQEFAIEVLGSDAVEQEVNHEFAFTIDYDYDDFMSDPRNRIDLLNKVARLYGDKNPKRMTVTKIERGSVVFAWTNNTLPTDDCPVGDIVQLMSKFLTKNLTLTEEAKKSMQPFVISKAAAKPQGSCADEDFEAALQASGSPQYGTGKPFDKPTPEPDDDGGDGKGGGMYETVKPSPEPGDGKDPETSKGDEEGDDIWITTVVPAVVIVAILLIALIIACILYRKKRKGKMNMQDHHTFVNKGIPVIFADELEDKPSESSKPLIMEEEKPPNPPPEYHRSSSESPGSTPPANHKDQAAAVDEEQELDENDVTSPLYRPPPPVTASSENKQPRPHVQPAYRNPPPYVPP